jgi:hypothetical protein
VGRKAKRMGALDRQCGKHLGAHDDDDGLHGQAREHVGRDHPEMHRSGVEHALVLGVVLAFVALVVGACGGPGAPEPRPLPEERRALPPGEYRSEEFEPSLSFRVGEGWATSPPELSDALLITRGHERGGLGFANVQEVFIYKPTKTSNPNVVEAPKDMVGWFRQHPYLRTEKAEPVKVGGVDGVRLDVAAGELPEDYFGDCGSGCVDLFRVGGAYPVSLWLEDKARFIVLEDVGGETVIVGFVNPAAEFDEHVPQAQKVIDTVEWRGK